MTLTNKEFLKHVSYDILHMEETPPDFESTLWDVLYQLPERNREVFLNVERDQIPVRSVGMEYEVSGQRIFDLNQSTKNTLITKWGDFLKTGIIQFMSDTAATSKKVGENEAKERYYKLGYTDGYEDGNRNKAQKHYAKEEFNAISLSDLSLSYRTHHYLFDEGLLNVSEIIERGDGILEIAHIGKGSYTELIERLSEFGVDVYAHFPKTMMKYNIKVEENNV